MCRQMLFSDGIVMASLSTWVEMSTTSLMWMAQSRKFFIHNLFNINAHMETHRASGAYMQTHLFSAWLHQTRRVSSRHCDVPESKSSFATKIA